MKRREFLVTVAAGTAATLTGCVPKPTSPEGAPEVSGAPSEAFLPLSAALTGCDPLVLQATGLTAVYLQALEDAVGPELLARLLQESAEGPESLVADPNLGPICARLTELWYLGAWRQLPEDWRARNGSRPGDESRILSPESYKQGLVWAVLDTHPPGDRQPGYGSWAVAPDV